MELPPKSVQNMLEQLLVTPNPGQWEKGPDMKPRRSFALDLKRPIFKELLSGMNTPSQTYTQITVMTTMQASSAANVPFGGAEMFHLTPFISEFLIRSDLLVAAVCQRTAPEELLLPLPLHPLLSSIE